MIVVVAVADDLFFVIRNMTAVTQCPVCTSTLFLTLGIYLFIQHTPVGLPLALVAWQDHPSSLVLESLNFTFTFAVTFFLKGHAFLDFSWSWVPCWDHSHNLITEVSI